MESKQVSHLTEHIRPAAVAGMFYPRDPEQLSATVDSMLAAVPIDNEPGTIIGIISPHAGYRYSGFTAAHGYKMLRGTSPQSIVIISPSHHQYFAGVSVYPGWGYMTPLGVLQIDEVLRDRILAEGAGLVHPDIAGHTEEHAIEVQLPFLQRVLGTVPIVPLVMGEQSKETSFLLGQLLGRILGAGSHLMIASSDLSHYHSSSVANQLDSIFCNEVATFNEEQLMSHLEQNRTEACGGGPVVAVMTAAKAMGATKARILHRCNSGDITAEQDRVVGYLSAALVRPS